jgi:hypothetical protein
MGDPHNAFVSLTFVYSLSTDNKVLGVVTGGRIWYSWYPFITEFSSRTVDVTETGPVEELEGNETNGSLSVEVVVSEGVV